MTTNSQENSLSIEQSLKNKTSSNKKIKINKNENIVDRFRHEYVF